MINKLAFQPTEGRWDCLLEQLSISKIQIAMVVTGGGTGVISRCLRRSGASLNFVEAVVPYSRLATQRYLGLEPTEGYASQHTANALAQVAHSRATSLTEKDQRCFGIALTATLPTKSDGYDADSTKLLRSCCFAERANLPRLVSLFYWRTKRSRCCRINRRADVSDRVTGFASPKRKHCWLRPASASEFNWSASQHDTCLRCPRCMSTAHPRLASGMRFPNEGACSSQRHQATELGIRERRRKLLVSSLTIHL